MNPSRQAVARASAVIISAACLTLVVSAAAGTAIFSRITVSPDTSSHNLPGAISSDDTRIVFESDADLKDENIIFPAPEIWLYDTQTITFTRITSATPASDGSAAPAINADGTKIVFHSDADLLGQGNHAGFSDVWLYDAASLTFTRITSEAGRLRDSLAADISADGTQIAFYSDGDFRNEGRPAGLYEIWLYDTTTPTYTRITSASAGGRNSLSPRLSADGSKIVFYSDSDFRNQGIPDGQNEIWLYDAARLTVTRITTSPQAGRDSFFPSIGAGGTRIAFQSNADFYTQGITTTQQEIWLHTASVTLTRVTTGTAGRKSQSARISADGSAIVFHSDADLLGQGIATNQSEAWLYTLSGLTVTRITTASSGDRDSRAPVINAYGTRIVFQSDSDFNGESIPAGQFELWSYQMFKAVYLPVVLKNSP